MKLKLVAGISMALLMAMGTTLSAMGKSDDVPRMTKEELKSQLGNSDMVILDVRQPDEWNGSKTKIQGAVREEPLKVKDWADKYPKDKTYVLYCS